MTQLQDEPVIGQPTPDELELLAGLRNGAPGSFEKLVRTYGGQMLRVARRLVRSEDDARDCVQEAFIQVHKHVAGFEGRSSLKSWLHRIVVNAALMRLRAAKRLQEDSIDDLLPQYDEDGHRVEPSGQVVASVEQELQARQTADIVRAAIDRLPDGYRTVLLLRDIEEYSTAETASLMQMEEGAVKVRLHRARAALKTLLQPVVAAGAA